MVLQGNKLGKLTMMNASDVAQRAKLQQSVHGKVKNPSLNAYCTHVMIAQGTYSR